MKREFLILHHVADQKQAIYGEAEEFGKWAAEALTGRRAQLTALQSIANSTLKVSDVLDYVKTKTARQDVWRHRRTDGKQFGPELLAFLQDNLKKAREAVCRKLPKEDGAAELREEQQIHLTLIREFLESVVAQYELEVNRRDP